jgi:uncharacterized protein
MAGAKGVFVVDASSIVRAALTDGSAAAKLLDALLDSGLLISSVAILNEVEEVLKRPKFRRWRSHASMQALALRIRTAARLVVPNVAVRECRDLSDDKYLEAALVATALHDPEQPVTIVSDDKDLLALDPWHGEVRILKPEAALVALANAT